MLKISTPKSPEYSPINKKQGKFEILECFPGYGATLGNALRRVLLSSLEGLAINSVKIKGVTHEFDTIKGVKEDVIQIILNLKKICFKRLAENIEGEEENIEVSLKKKGEGKVTAGDIKCPSSMEVVNKDQVICTITDKKIELEIELRINQGLSYVPSEQQREEEREIGVIAIDAIYTPIKRVNYTVSNMRVGKRTDYDKIDLEVETDGSITPQEAFNRSVEILVEQFSALAEINIQAKEEEKEEIEEDVPEEEEEVKEPEINPEEIPITEIKNLSTRTLNVLQANNIETIKDVVTLREEDIQEMEGMGNKGIKEVKKAIGVYGVTLKQKNYEA